MNFAHLNLKPLCSALIAASLLSACGGGGGSDTTSPPPVVSPGGSGDPATPTNPPGGTRSDKPATPPSGTLPGPVSPGDPSGGSTEPAPGGPTNPPGGNQPTPTDPPEPPPATPTPPAPPPATAPMTMTCIDGPTYQCSGSSIIRVDNGVALTSSGVQAYGKSTSDLETTIADTTTGYGLALASGGIAEMRLAKDSNGAISGPALLLSNLGISWDRKTERPQIIETFHPSAGRVQLDSRGALTFGALPDSANLGFYDYANKGTAATQANYANNRYFPRLNNPPRCGPTIKSCPTTETTGVKYQAGNWRTAGTTPDWSTAIRLHGDGDVHAGDGKPDANGNRTILPGGSGPGVPFPGSKGYRGFGNWSYQYANLNAWVTQDTVSIVEWSPGALEHNQNRRGIVTFGAVTDPALVPATGSATYSGIAYGWYAPNGKDEPTVFWGMASATVNFATRQVVVTIQNTVTYDAAGKLVPVAFKATTAMGAAGANAANYLSGTVNNNTVKGGVGGRYFGPLVSSGSSGTGPAEIGGAFSLSDAPTGKAVVGGFIARKQ